MPTPVEWLGYYDVNTGAAATGTQTNAQTIGLANGNYLVAWTEGADGSIGTTAGSDIVGKIYDAEGNVVRDAYRINTARASENEGEFDLVATADGGFLIAYTSSDIVGDDGGRVYWERHNAVGDTVNSLLIADAEGDDFYTSPQITTDLFLDRSVVTYEFNEGGLFDENLIVEGRLINANGTTVSGFLAGSASDEGGNYIDNGDVAFLTGGRIVAAYVEEDDGIRSPEAGIFDSVGNLITRIAISNGFQDTSNLQIAALANGNWVATWEVRDPDRLGQLAFRVFDANGAEVTGGTVAESSRDEVSPDVVALPDGDFVISWGVPGFSSRTFAQRFDSDGVDDGRRFTVSDQPYTASGLAADGRLLFASDSGLGEIRASIWDPRDSSIFDFNFSESFPGMSRIFLDPYNFTTLPTSTLLAADDLANQILARDGNDTLYGYAGNDSIFGRAGSDYIEAGFGADRAEGSDGDDTIIGGQGSDILNGGAGRDTVSYVTSLNPVNVSINGGIDVNTGGDAAADELFAFERLEGSSYDDTLRGEDNFSDASHAFVGNGGNDSMVGGGSSEVGGGNDTLFGDAGNDTIFGGVGADSISGGVDNDSVNGNAGNDTVNGGAGNDTLLGGANGFGLFSAGGSDQLFGDGGADSLFGDVSNDTLNGGGDGDTLNGGTGIDWADYSTASAKVTADLVTPSVNLGDALGDSYVSIENLRGTRSKDKLSGDDLVNRIEGLGSADVLAGRGGNDTLAGGAGKDKLTGGGGADDFELASVLAADADTIKDFAPGEDRIALGAVFGLSAGTLQPELFVVGNSAGDGDDRLIYKLDTGELFFDPDGSGAQAQVLIATLTGAPIIDAGDFIVLGGALQVAPSDARALEVPSLGSSGMFDLRGPDLQIA